MNAMGLDLRTIIYMYDRYLVDLHYMTSSSSSTRKKECGHAMYEYMYR